MKSAVIVFPGSNRERDAARAIESVSGRKPVMAWHGDAELPDVDLIVLPGGFSYGDYLRCGAIAARSPVMRDVIAKARRGVKVLGICNGFQILTEAGLLPGALMRNRTLTFICHDAHLRVERNDTAFTNRYAPGQVVRFPVAHGEGNYYADEDTLRRLEGDGRVLFRYVSPAGAATDEANRNGSRLNIAGILNEQGNVLGLMPHPENHIDPLVGGTDGRPLFESLLAA
jgi:phosphoribosylformylglycinamidine synthase